MRKIELNAKVNNGIITGNFPVIAVTRSGETRQEIDNSAFGTLFELLIANIANEKDHRQSLKSQGKADVKHHYNYDVKQASSPIKYGEKDYIFGSSRLIYAPFIKYEILQKSDVMVTLKIDIKEQNVYCIAKNDFLEIIDMLGLKKENKSRDTININTIWNYTKNAPHSKKKLRELVTMLEQYNMQDDELLKKIKSI